MSWVMSNSMFPYKILDQGVNEFSITLYIIK